MWSVGGGFTSEEVRQHHVQVRMISNEYVNKDSLVCVQLTDHFFRVFLCRSCVVSK